MSRHSFEMSKKKKAELARDEKRREQERSKELAALMTPLFGKPISSNKSKKIESKMPSYELKRETVKRKSPVVVGDLSTATAKKAPLQYTGEKLIGIAMMHKSNLVPIFNTEEAIDVATMRRS